MLPMAATLQEFTQYGSVPTQAPSSPLMQSRQASTGPALAQTIVHAPVTLPGSYMIQEKAEAQLYAGLSAQEVSGMLQQERPRIYSAIQDIIQQSIRTCSDGLNGEIAKVMSMVNAVSATCDERLIRLEVDRAARNTHLQGYRRDVDCLQSQINELAQAKAGSSSESSDALGKEREETLVRINSITKDMRSQYHSLIAGLNSQKEQNTKVDQALVELRQRTAGMLERLQQQQEDKAGLEGKVEKAVGDLRAQVNTSLQGFQGEVQSLRALGDLPDRVVRLEDKNEELYRAFLDQDLGELTRVVRAESQARIGLSESLDSYRQAYLQTTTELRAQLDSIVQKQTLAGATSEDRSRIGVLERSLSEVRNMVSTQTMNSRIESRGADVFLTKDIQELSGRVSAESAARLDLSSSLDAYRSAHLQTTTELRAELDVAREKLARLESSVRSFDRREKTGPVQEVALDSNKLLLTNKLSDDLRSWKVQ